MPTDPRLVALCAALQESRRELAESVAGVPPEGRAVRPAPDRWSVAEILEHCALVEVGSTRLIAALAESAPTRADVPAPDAAGEGGWTVDRRVITNRAVRVPAPEFLHPTAGADADAAWARLDAARAALLAAIEAADGRALETVTRPHPALGPLNGYQWISAVAGHEARHAAQVRELAGAGAGAPAGAA